MKLVIGKGSCGIAAGADKVSDSAEKYIAEKNLNIPVSVTGCIGMCYLEPIVDIIKDNGEKTTYVKVTADAIKEIYAKNTLFLKKIRKDSKARHVLL